jgi:hypothetical protein
MRHEERERMIVPALCRVRLFILLYSNSLAFTVEVVLSSSLVLERCGAPVLQSHEDLPFLITLAHNFYEMKP